MALWNPFQIFFANTGVSGGLQAAASLQLRIISYNVRYATSSPFTNERPWPEREPLLTNQILHELRFADLPQSPPSVSIAQSSNHVSAFVCLQEVLHNQLVDILAVLNDLPDDKKGETPSQGPHWAHIGVGRDDGETEGEYSPILYPVQTFELLHYETVWLSPTPDKPSKGWGAGSIRILTIGVFEHKRTKRQHIAANTHLDNASSESRLESVKLILSTLRRIHQQWSRKQSLPLFLTGDFNSFPEQEAYLAMRDDGWMVDLHEVISPRNRYGDEVTFTGFEPEKDVDERGRIDFIWFGPQGKSATDQEPNPWSPTGYAVLPNVFDDEIYLSDHRAVVGDLRLN